MFSINNQFPSSIQTCNNFYQRSIENMLKTLIDSLGEVLIYLSSIIQCQNYSSLSQSDKLGNIAEYIYQIRLILQKEINNKNDILLISRILYELSSCIHSINREQKQQQQIQIINKSSNMIIFTQLLDRLEKLIEACFDCINNNNNSRQNLQPSTANICPCLNSSRTIDDSAFSNRCLPQYDISNICIPWSLINQIRCLNENNNIFGIMYGIKDENIRRKLGYGVSKQQSLNKRQKIFQQVSAQKYKPNNHLNEERSSTDDQKIVIPKALVVSNKEEPISNDQQNVQDRNETIRTNSKISQKMINADKFSNNRIASQEKTIANPKRPSPITLSNFDNHESSQLPSAQDNFTVSSTFERPPTQATSSLKEALPMTATSDQNQSKRTFSRQIQQPSNIYEKTNDESLQSLSSQTYGYKIPSKMIVNLSHGSSQNLSPLSSKSIYTKLSNKVAITDDVTQKKSTSSITKNDDTRSINQSTVSNKTHTGSNGDTRLLASGSRITHNDSSLYNNSKRGLASPLSIASTKQADSTLLQQNIISPNSIEQLLLDENQSDFYFDDKSLYKISPSTSLFIETNDTISPLTITEEPQSTEILNNILNNSDNNNN